MKRLSALFCSFACLGLSQPAVSQSALKTGTITSIWASGGNNYGLRIALKSGQTDQLASCAGDFAYINISDDNYQVRAALVMTAYTLQKTVNVHVASDSQGFCRIDEIWTA